jgi:hypothetical protein
MVKNGAMRPSITATELGLVLIFISRSVTRIYQRRAIELYGMAGAKVAQIPGNGVIPLWVSFIAVIGWSTALVAAGFWIMFG